MKNPGQKLTLIVTVLALIGSIAATSVFGTGDAKPAVPAAAVAMDGEVETFTPIDVPGATGTLALDINAEGWIVGRYAMAGQTHGFVLTAAGEFASVDFPGASFTVAASINERGDIVGMYALPTAPTQRHGYLLKDGVFSSFDPPGSMFTNALGINDRGDIVGRFCVLSRCRPTASGDFRGFLLRDGEFTVLDAPGAIETHAFKINSSGLIAGVLVTNSGEENVSLWRKNQLTIMALPNGRPVSIDNGGINERGDIVGLYCDGPAPCALGPTGTHGFLISGDDFRVIDVPDSRATSALGINARGDIVGGYFDSAGRSHGFLMHR